MLSFKGGILPDEHKYTREAAVEAAFSPEFIRLGTEGRALAVKEGETVSGGQALTEDFSVISGISGTVTEISDGFIAIKNDFSSALHSTVIQYEKSIADSGREELTDYLTSKGFDFSKKLFLERDNYEVLVILCGETEPFVCSGYRVYAERKREIALGAKILMHVLGAANAVFAVEAFYGADKAELAALIGEDCAFSIMAHTSKYPANAPAVSALMLRRHLKKIKLRCNPDNSFYVTAEECAAVYEAFKTGMPYAFRTVTVDGDAVAEPGVLRVPLGTPVKEMLMHCKADVSENVTYILGSPLNGKKCSYFACTDKSTSAVLALSRDYLSEGEAESCIKCGKCHRACPMGLYPAAPDGFSRSFLGKCIDCGCCSYVCPSRIDLSLQNRFSEEVDANV